MAIEVCFYLVPESVAERAGLVSSRYKIEDGRYVLNNRDLARVRFTADEYITGLQGIEKISHQEAADLIAQNNYNINNTIQENNLETQENETQEEEQVSEEQN